MLKAGILLRRLIKSIKSAGATLIEFRFAPRLEREAIDSGAHVLVLTSQLLR